MAAPSSKLYRHRKPLRDIVGERIRAAIVDGTLPPGTRLVERDLAERYEVSRLPVREALRVLQNEGLVEHLATRGMVVRVLDRRQVSELFDIREALESLAAAQAALRIAAGAENLLPTTVEEARAALAAGDPEAAQAAGSRFHDQITELSDNRLLAEVLQPLVSRLGWLRHRNEGLTATCAEHEDLSAAISSGDPDRAAAAALAHVRASRERTTVALFGPE